MYKKAIILKGPGHDVLKGNVLRGLYIKTSQLQTGESNKLHIYCHKQTTHWSEVQHANARLPLAYRYHWPTSTIGLPCSPSKASEIMTFYVWCFPKTSNYKDCMDKLHGSNKYNVCLKW